MVESPTGETTDKDSSATARWQQSRCEEWHPFASQQTCFVVMHEAPGEDGMDTARRDRSRRIGLERSGRKVTRRVRRFLYQLDSKVICSAAIRV